MERRVWPRRGQAPSSPAGAILPRPEGRGLPRSWVNDSVGHALGAQYRAVPLSWNRWKLPSLPAVAKVRPGGRGSRALPKWASMRDRMAALTSMLRCGKPLPDASTSLRRTLMSTPLRETIWCQMGDSMKMISRASLAVPSGLDLRPASRSLNSIELKGILDTG